MTSASVAGIDTTPRLEAVPCPLCGTASSRQLYEALPDRRHWLPGRFDVVACRRCGLVRTNPRPSSMQITGYYPSSYVSFASRRAASGRLATILKQTLRLPYRLRYGSADRYPMAPWPGARLLDVGCGQGTYLAEMATRGWDVWGIEP